MPLVCGPHLEQVEPGDHLVQPFPLVHWDSQGSLSFVSGRGRVQKIGDELGKARDRHPCGLRCACKARWGREAPFTGQQVLTRSGRQDGPEREGGRLEKDPPARVLGLKGPMLSLKQMRELGGSH